MLAILFMNYGLKWFIGAVIGLIVFIVLGFTIDIRFFFLCMIWIFLLLPLVVAFLYFYYGMDPLTAFNAMPHKITFTSDKATIMIRKKNHEEDTNNSSPEENFEYKPYSVNLSEFKSLKTGSDYVLLFFGKKGFIWLPVYAFSSPGDLKELIYRLK